MCVYMCVRGVTVDQEPEWKMHASFAGSLAMTYVSIVVWYGGCARVQSNK